MKKFLFLIFFFPVILFSNNIKFEEPWGKDADLKYKIKENSENSSSSIFTKVADKIILFHQKVLSPVDGPRSNFRPTSSRYMQLAMQRFGFFKGYIMGCDRLLRENNDKWVYQTINIDNVEYKYDPAKEDKYLR